MSVSVTPSISSPAPLGTAVTFSATVADAFPGTIGYQFRVRPAGGAFRPVVDFGPKTALTWTTIQKEGTYEIEVSARNSDTTESVSTSMLFTFNPLINGSAPAVNTSANPMVSIYSAPSCAAGGRMRVEFTSPAGVVQDTPWKACNGSTSMNFYLAGMLASSTYTAFHILDSGTNISTGPKLSFTTGAPDGLTLANTSVLTSPPAGSVDGIVLQSLIGTNAIASDLNGNLLWYSPSDISFITRPQAGGTFLAIYEDENQDSSNQTFREFDLAGITVAETNAARVSEQLAALGIHSINGFHHEARKLKNGDYLVLADSERVLTDVQGPGPVDVIGDTIIVLDQNLQVQWAWDSFDHLDTSRAATLGETCTNPNPGCAVWYLATTANDWLHGNSLQLTPDGNILYSARHQDWVFKIDYENGVGSGAVLWRFGQDGDFTLTSSDPNPWFSHQHDANFLTDNSTMVLFDDGNVRYQSDPTAHSRGQVFSVDEGQRAATQTLNADLGSYSSAVGSAQYLPNGDYHFDCGFIVNAAGNFSSQSVEVDPSGNIVYAIQLETLAYRSFRMQDLYTDPK